MKKLAILLLTFILLISSLSSCTVINKKVTINGQAGILEVQEMDNGNSYRIVLDGTEYVFAKGHDDFLFYRNNGEPIAYYWGAFGLTSINVLKHDDFGIAFTIVNPMFGNFISTPFLSENTVFPETKSIVVDDIVFVGDDGVVNNFTYLKLADHNDLKSQKNSKVCDKSLWNENDEAITLGNIINFDEPVILNEEYQTYYRDIVFVPQDYTSFICGPFKKILLNGEWYITLDKEHIDNPVIYKVREEYQEFFGNPFGEE